MGWWWAGLRKTTFHRVHWKVSVTETAGWLPISSLLFFGNKISYYLHATSFWLPKCKHEHWVRLLERPLKELTWMGGAPFWHFNLFSVLWPVMAWRNVCSLTVKAWWHRRAEAPGHLMTLESRHCNLGTAHTWICRVRKNLSFLVN